MDDMANIKDNSYRQGVVILGSTGSIGQNTLAVLDLHPDKYKVIALSAHRNIHLLMQQIKKYQPYYVAVSDPKYAKILTKTLKQEGRILPVLSGPDGLIDIVSLEEANIVVAGIVGAAGLLPTLAAVCAAKRVLLANKEPLVMAGSLFMDAAREYGGILLPLDSEHNAIFQSMPRDYRPGNIPEGVERLILTASGGPFRHTPMEKMIFITPALATKHPNWKMGKKITVDCSTLMNKGLELIEAHFLFNMPGNKIDIVVHPQSVIHSLVAYKDGSLLAQLGMPDMRIPIANCLAWPERIISGVKALNLLEVGMLAFEPYDSERFPTIDFAYHALKRGGAWPCILNAVNEVAVEAFLNEEISFPEIFSLLNRCLHETRYAKLSERQDNGLEAILDIDRSTRRLVLNDITKRKQTILIEHLPMFTESVH
jgi:1-deoxy-D-xylulose-5-phosphate reductoisomerase